MTQFNTMNEPTPRHSNHRTSAHAPSAHQATKPSSQGTGLGQGDGGRILLSRRQLLYGAVGLGAVAAVGAGVAAFSSSSSQSESVAHLEVSSNDVTALSEFEALENYDDKIRLINDHELPYGTLIWMNDDEIAACLLPTDTGAPLTQVALFSLNSAAEPTTVLERAVGSEDHFEIYDVRATSQGLIWTEANVLEGTWRIYSAPLAGLAVESPTMLEEGDSTYETPSIAAVGNKVFWQVLPKDPNTDKLPYKLMGATIGQDNASCIFESARRMATPVYAGKDCVTITPRINSATPYYQLTNINASTGEVADQITLPSAMTPLEAGYGETGFMFSFADIYNHGDGISNLGTYTPMTNPGGDYSNAKWFSFARTPTAPPSWCNDLLIVKSTRAVCGVNLKDRTYFAIDVDDGADSYGEYLASTGSHDTFVTYTNIDHSPVEGESTHACRVKVYTTLS